MYGDWKEHMLFFVFNISVNHVKKNTLQCINYNKAFHSRLPFLLYGQNLNNLNDKKLSVLKKITVLILC